MIFIHKKFGFSLLETIVASTIATIVMVSTVAVVSHIYKKSKTIQFTQNFYSESRLLINRITEISRNNTIDYDRYFVESGPGVTNCSNFDDRQINDHTDSVNNRDKRILETYPGLFYWDIDTTADGEKDRNLFGEFYDNVIGVNPDKCINAWHLDLATKKIISDTGASLPLYLINSTKDIRYTIEFKNNTIELTTELGTDIDGDNQAYYYNSGAAGSIVPISEWSSDTAFVSSICKVQILGIWRTIKGASGNKQLCTSAHAATIISNPSMKILDFSYKIGPQQDPFLATRLKSSRVHPYVEIFLDLELKNPESYGMPADKLKISLQTFSSSRVYGNIRKELDKTWETL